MKKIFTFLMMLCTFVGTTAQAFENGIYTLQVDKNQQRGFVAAGEGYTDYPILSDVTLSGYTDNDAPAIENGKYWYVVSINEGESYYFYNVGIKKFLVGGSQINFGDEPYAWSFSANSSNSGYYNIEDVAKRGYYLSGGCGRKPNERPMAYESNNKNDGGALYTLTPVTDITLAEVDNAFKVEYESNINTVVNGAAAIIDSENLDNTYVGAWKTNTKLHLSVPYSMYLQEDGATLLNYLALNAEYQYWVSHPEEARVQLNPGETFKVLCKHTARGYMVYNSDYKDYAYLAGATDWNATYKLPLDNEKVFEDWTVISAEGKKYIYNIENKKYISSESPVKFSDTPHAVNLIDLDNGLWEIQFENNQYLAFSPGWGENPVRTTGNIDDGNKFYIIKTGVNINISAAGWATTYLPFDVVLPEGLTAYAVSAINMSEGANVGYATLEEKTSIPANEGAILKGEQGSYSLKFETATDSWEGNMLEGSNVDTYVEGPAYVLGNKEGVALYQALLNKDANGNDGDSHFLNNANKAYLPITEGTSLVLRFNFGGTTAIESVLNNGVDANAPIYDLSGRRVMNAVKGGIYIQNGKKFIVK